MKDDLLLPLEELEKHLRHASPVVRDWAWERLEEIYPERLPEFVPLALEEKDTKVFQTILRIFRDHASLLSPELQESLKDAVLERLRREKSRNLLLGGIRFLGTIGSLCQLLMENSWLAERVFADEKFSYFFFSEIFYELPISEREALHALLDEPIPEWEAHSAGYRIWETADPSPIKEVYVRLHDEIPHILTGLEIVLPKKDYFLGILPEKVAQALEKPVSSIPVTVTLGCKECGYYFPFKPRLVLIGEEDPDLPERVVCPRCGAEDSFLLPEIEKGRLKTRWLILRAEGKEFKEWEDEIWSVKELIVNVKGRRQTFTRYREALAYYRRMVEVQAGDPEVLSGYLHLLLKGRRLEEAEKTLEQLERLKPDCVDYAYLRAVYHRLRGEPEKALEFYRQAVEALARGAPFYRFYPQESAEALKAIFFEARDYARTTGKPFSIKEDLLWKKKKVGRNDPCPCGSGKKYKKCCLKKKEGAPPEKKSAQSAEERKAFRFYEEFVV